MRKTDKKGTLNYIKAIADVKSISLAADNLGISQPALSSYLKKLEAELNTVLFDRSKQPLELTEAGRLYLDYVDKEVALRNEFMQNLADIEGLNKGRLYVGGASFFIVAYIAKAVAAFTGKYPGIDMEIMDAKVQELVKSAQKGILDIFITPFNDDEDRFVYEELLEEKIYLAVPAEWEVNDRLEGKAIARREDSRGRELTAEEFRMLCGYPFILLQSEQHIRQKMDRLFEKYKCSPEQTITAEQTMTSLALTSEAAGISLITDSSMRCSALRHMPKLYMADSDICSRKIYIAYPKCKYLSKASREFIKVLKELNR